MNAYHPIRSLRSLRNFADRPMSDDGLRQVLEAGRCTRSSQTTQPRQFVVRERDTLGRLAQCGRFLAGHLKSATFAIALVMDMKPGRTEFDSGRCAQNLMRAARSQGVGLCVASLHNENAAKQVLAVTPERGMRRGISFGYRASALLPQIEGKPRERVLALWGRQPLAEFVHVERR
jgi:nitroreductase